MRIFMSHASRNKQLVKSLRRELPPYFDAWIDEEQLLIGQDLGFRLESTIAKETDFVVLWVDDYALRSTWVQRELVWALEAERAQNREIIIPIVLDTEAWDAIEPVELRKRIYLPCTAFEDNDIRALAMKLQEKLLGQIVHRFDALKTRDDVDLRVANEVRTILFPHRQSSPMPIEDLLASMRNIHGLESTPEWDVRELLEKLQSRALLTGLYLDEDEAYTEISLYHWRKEANVDAKMRVARAAARMIKDDSVITLDSGTTTKFIAQHILRRFLNYQLSRITVITNSIPAAMELASGFGNVVHGRAGTGPKVLLAGGRVRSSTLAVLARVEDTGANIRTLTTEAVDRVDMAFVGTSGIGEQGFTTGSFDEQRTKQALLAEGAQRVIVTDPSKFGVTQDKIFCEFPGVQVVSVRDDRADYLDKWEGILSASGASIKWV